MSRSVYENPLCTRYAGKKMQQIFSDDNRYGVWRRLWLALAKGEKALGLDITDQMISEMESNLDNIDYDTVARREKEVRHDVMAHVYAFGLVAPHAKPIIHLGATSCFVTDNGDIVIFREALLEIRNKLLAVVKNLGDLAEKYKALPCLAYTHLQPAQLTTVGKRFTLYIQDLLMDLESVDFALSQLKLRGVKGTTGTQASFLTLFDGDGEKVDRLEKFIAAEMGFDKVFDVTGQTYTRKLDYTILSALSAVAQSAYKFSNDMRILQSRKEMEEPFEKNQIGSSAMAYKRNPMRSERMGSLARFVISLPLNEAVCVDAVVREDAGRLRKPSHNHTAGVSCVGRRSEPVRKHNLRARGLRKGGVKARGRGAALYGNRIYPYGGGQAGRRQAGAA